MEKVEMMVFGKRALVDADMAKKMTRKEALVGKAMGLQDGLENSAVPKTDPMYQMFEAELHKTMGQIIRLNRTIRQNVRFI
jgi:hypothetical protein